jgi:hypothetical protein
MSVPCKFEKSLLTYDEQQTVFASHHPAIYDASFEELKALRQRLRDLRGKETTLSRTKRREQRGKGEPRGASFPGTAERSFQRKQIFGAAVKRVSKEVTRQIRLERRAAHMEAATRALEMRRAAQFPPRPEAGYTAYDGARPLPSLRKRTVIPRARIGSISQATRIAQAVRDART